MPIKIRILQSGDETILEHVDPDVFDDPIQPKAAQEFLNDNRHHLVVATDKNIVIGFASGVHYIHPDKSRPEFWINEVGVSSSYHKQGVGKALVHALLEKARSIGCSEAWVLTERANVPAMRLYQSIGADEAADESVMFTFHL